MKTIATIAGGFLIAVLVTHNTHYKWVNAEYWVFFIPAYVVWMCICDRIFGEE